MMQNIDFEHDPRSRKVTRYFLWLQLAALISVPALVSLRLHSLALVLSSITLLLSGVLCLWLYRRYQSLPQVREKNELQRQVLQIQGKVAGAQQLLARTRQDREHLLRKEQFTLDATLLNQQTHHIQKGLSACSVKDATISEVEPQIKESLGAAGIATALDVTEEAISQVPGLGAAKRVALMQWQSLLQAQFDLTKPVRLPDYQLEFIQKKFQRLHVWNDEKEKTAADYLLQVVVELDVTQQRLKQMAPITFRGYLGHALASKG
jgi:DNA-binding helix-hairpin-helix protein with protein kinase domain